MAQRTTAGPSFAVVIPAHDEESVIGRTLRFTAELAPGEADVVVVANGCNDATAKIAAGAPGVRVVELPTSGKAQALNAGDQATAAYPRIYLDADIDVDAATLRRMRDTLLPDEARVCSPAVTFRTAGRPWTVRAYYRVYSLLPYVRNDLVGLGVYGVSEAGRRRFGQFPAVANDDTFVQRLFAPAERTVLRDGRFAVETPHDLASLTAVRTRVAAGNTELAGLGDAHAGTTGGTGRALVGLVLRRPWLLPHAAVYLGVTVLARLRARSVDGSTWLRDGSTRAATTARPLAIHPPATHPPVAYLVSMHPKVSHAFIDREIKTLRGLGVPVHTFSVRPVPDSEVLTDESRAERERTPVLLASYGALARATLDLGVRHPHVAVRALAQALRSGPGTAGGRLWQLFYLAEAVLLARHMRAVGARHVHVHLANNSADVARLTCTIGNGLDQGSWSWSLAMHGPTEFADVAGTDLAAKVRSARFVACISDFCRSQLMNLVEPEHWAKLKIVRMSVDPQAYPPMLDSRETRARENRTPDRPLRVVFVGRLVPEKGPTLLLDAVAALPAGSVQVRIVGDGPLRPELERRAGREDLRGHVELLGALGQDTLPEQYRWADVFCLPSLAEGLPVVLMEAMATGLPVVTTRIAGIPELVDDDRTGLLVPPGRSNAVAAALDRLRDPQLRARLGTAAAAAVVRQHDAQTNGAALLNLLAAD